MREKVQAALDKVRPALQADGGDVELVDVTPQGIVQVRLTGACHGCPMSRSRSKTASRGFFQKCPGSRASSRSRAASIPDVSRQGMPST
jgi:Fe-S cluster biogenesis protein NfuA